MAVLSKGNDMLCSIDGCDTKIWCRDLCKKHYGRLAKHGDPTKTLTPTLGLSKEDSFAHHVIKRDGCWEWGGSKSTFGYGHFSVDGKIVTAHRSSWEIHHGDIPGGMFVLHHCDNPECSNPDHLFLGTHAENMRDMINKGRSTYGERNPNCKLTEGEVLDVVARLAQGEKQSKIATIYGVSQLAISSIKTGKRWQRVTGIGVSK